MHESLNLVLVENGVFGMNSPPEVLQQGNASAHVELIERITSLLVPPNWTADNLRWRDD